MKPPEIRAMVDEELAAAVEDARRALFNLSFQEATGRLEDTSRLSAARRDLARLLTIQRERELWAEVGADEAEE